ncbi:MAG TPA: glycosyltransferase family 2 protein [Alcaligenes sp.]|nr:glycosyltransferase family 2 protein [Alcaligenes sp.]HRL27708.1 glycosyltransferase family 2 protein [Alcaligenes sp.]
MSNIRNLHAPLRLETRAPTLSLLVPVYNEVEVLPHCYARLRSVLDELDLRYELVFVDDGSVDGSSDALAALACTQANIKVVRLSRNFGKEAALTAGLQHCAGAAVITLDADLQDPPELIPDMVRAWRAGADIVRMRRRSRAGDPWHKRLSAHLYYRLLNWLSDVHIPEDTGDFRLMSARAVQALLQLPERSRYMKGLFAWIGLPTTELLYERHARAAGKTKWNYRGLLGLAIEGITSFSIKPLRWASGLGLLVAGTGLTYGLFIAAKTLLYGEAVHGYPSLVAIIAFLGGMQLITMGLLGEYVGKTYMETKQRPIYLIRDVLQSSTQSAADKHTSSTEQYHHVQH